VQPRPLSESFSWRSCIAGVSKFKFLSLSVLFSNCRLFLSDRSPPKYASLPDVNPLPGQCFPFPFLPHSPASQDVEFAQALLSPCSDSQRLRAGQYLCFFFVSTEKVPRIPPFTIVTLPGRFSFGPDREPQSGTQARGTPLLPQRSLVFFQKLRPAIIATLPVPEG